MGARRGKDGVLVYWSVDDWSGEFGKHARRLREGPPPKRKKEASGSTEVSEPYVPPPPQVEKWGTPVNDLQAANNEEHQHLPALAGEEEAQKHHGLKVGRGDGEYYPSAIGAQSMYQPQGSDFQRRMKSLQIEQSRLEQSVRRLLRARIKGLKRTAPGDQREIGCIWQKS